MKRFLLILIVVLIIASPVSANYFPDITVTSTDGIWTDTRAFATINAAATAIGAVDKRTIVIPNEQVVTALTITSNITLKFERDGSIANSGQLTIQTPNIIADDHQIFTGAGDIDFASGSVVRSTWFSDIDEALDVTSDDTLTMIIAQTETTTADLAVGNNVTLKWNSPFILTVAGAHTLSNVKNIEAGNYQILAGAGDVDFLDGSELNLDWFLNLRAVITWVETEEVTINVYGTHAVDFTDATTINERLDLSNGSFTIAIATTLTTVGPVKAGPDAFTLTGNLIINGPFDAGLYTVFNGAGTASNLDKLYPEWFGATGDEVTDDYAALAATVTNARAFESTIVLSKIYMIGTTLDIFKSVDVIGSGISTGFLLTMGTGDDGIAYGNTESSASVVKHSTWKDFGIYGAVNACRNALVLTGMLQNRFENIHVMAGTHATGYGVWVRWSQSNHLMNFIIGQFTNQYPVAVTVPEGGFKSTSSAGAASTFIDNVLDVIIEGMDLKGIWIYGGTASSITGLSEGITDYALHLQDADYMHIYDFYSETASAVADENEIYIENGDYNILGPGIFSIPGAPNNTDVKIINSRHTSIDGLFCSILSIDSTSFNTRIGKITTSGQSGSDIKDSGINTSQLFGMAGGYEGVNNTGILTDANSTLINGSLERWIDANNLATGSSFTNSTTTFTRETTIVQHGISSLKVDVIAGDATKYFKITPPALSTITPRGFITVTGWIYIPTADGLDLILGVYWGVNPYTSISVPTTRDVWNKMSFSVDITKVGTLTGLSFHLYNSSGANYTFYTDGWSAVPGVAGGASLFTPNANEFPIYTGTAVWDPGSIAASGYSANDFTVLGAELGMPAQTGVGVDVTDLVVTATVTAANTVTVVLFNPTVGAIDLASSTWNVSVMDIN